MKYNHINVLAPISVEEELGAIYQIEEEVEVAYSARDLVKKKGKTRKQNRKADRRGQQRDLSSNAVQK